MWFSFSTNICILLVGVISYLYLFSPKVNKHLRLFVLCTGISAGIAAFGHLELLALETQQYLLVLSRILNTLSIFFFATGALRHFSYYDTKWICMTSNILFTFFMLWLISLNIKMPGAKESFFPVILYGIIGMILIGAISFILNLRENINAHSKILGGVLLIAVSAVIFKILPEMEGIQPADISHIFIAIGLVLMTFGFKKLKQNELNK